MVRYCRICEREGNTRTQDPTLDHVNAHIMEDYAPDYSNIDCDCLCHDSMYRPNRGSNHCWICDPLLSQGKKEAIRRSNPTLDIEYRMTNDMPLPQDKQEYLNARRLIKPNSMGRVRKANNLIHPIDRGPEETP